jgi:Na+-driven multidrug efflux pump
LSVLPEFVPLTLTGVWIVLGLDLLTQAVIFSRLHVRGAWLDARV